MSQLTSIESLRNSPALQNRVTTVENFLKRHNRDWQRGWWFPIALINVSNDQADMDWVRSHTSTHLKPTGNLVCGATSAPAEKVIEALKGLRMETETDLEKLNAALATAFGTPVAWTAGIVTSEVAAAQAPFAQAASVPSGTQASPTSKPTTTKSSAAKKSSTVKPIVTSPAKRTKLDEAKELFGNLTPKQKVELVAWAEQKVLASKPCLAEREKLNTAAA